MILRCLLISLLACASLAWSAEEIAPNRKPVKAVGDQRIEVRSAAGAGTLHFYASRPLGDGAVQADVDRVVLVFHGRLRDADVYWRSALKAAQAAPQASKTHAPDRAAVPCRARCRGARPAARHAALEPRGLGRRRCGQGPGADQLVRGRRRPARPACRSPALPEPDPRRPGRPFRRWPGGATLRRRRARRGGTGGPWHRGPLRRGQSVVVSVFQRRTDRRPMAASRRRPLPPARATTSGSTAGPAHRRTRNACPAPTTKAATSSATWSTCWARTTPTRNFHRSTNRALAKPRARTGSFAATTT